MAITNPFKQKPPVEKPARNAFDLSHAVNFTAKFGTLYPVMCKEVIPGDSFNIESTMGLRLMPLAFPVQSRIRANVHFFYVRNRTIWDNWTRFITANKANITPPFIQMTQQTAPSMIGTGTIGDYLGVPTTVALSSLDTYSSPMMAPLSNWQAQTAPQDADQIPIPALASDDSVGWKKNQSYPTINAANIGAIKMKQFDTYQLAGTGTIANCAQSMACKPLSKTNKVTANSKFELVYATGNPLPTRVYFFFSQEETFKWKDSILFGLTLNSLNFTLSGGVWRSASFNAINVRYINGDQTPRTLDVFLNKALEGGIKVYMVFETALVTDNNNPKDTTSPAKYNNIFNGLNITNIGSPIIAEISQQNNCPYTGANPAIRLSALPFRAYEAVYNSFYRNQEVDPLKINGEPEYERFVINIGDGADTFPYTLYNRNWEQDFLTTALPSPQQGIAPLVGARVQGKNVYNLVATIDGTKKTLEVHADETGQLQPIQNYQTGDGAGYFPESTVAILNQLTEFGISINDFRNVNCLQRWLEKNIRRGYRYRNQIMSHFGVEISYDTLNMPEFLGGVTQDIQINSISQTVDTADAPLGSYAGQGHCFGGSEHNVSRYFDEHGFVIAMFSISPIPTYSQLLPKHFLKQHHLDHYTPEFAHIGLQPITISEITPNEEAITTQNFTKVFGYQRPYYDYLASVDTVHGQMRTTLRDCLVNRYFEVSPTLASKFLKIDSEECNDIFTVTDNSNDNVIGQIYFKIIAKRPIPRFSEPRLE